MKIIKWEEEMLRQDCYCCFVVVIRHLCLRFLRLSTQWAKWGSLLTKTRIVQFSECRL